MISFKITCQLKSKELFRTVKTNYLKASFLSSGYQSSVKLIDHALHRPIPPIPSSRFCRQNFLTTMPLPFERLPKTVVPKVYDIRIKPDLKAFKFDGKVRIECNVVESTSEVIFNAVELELSNVKFEGKDGKEILAEKVEINAKDEKAVARFPVSIPSGKGYLSMDFIGELNDAMKGFYRSKYSLDGEDRYAAVTQFEPTDAHRAFPCWDEPAIKAVFNITVVTPKDRVALSNMNCISNEIDPDDPNLKIVKFAPTPIMSTYLVAVVVGEYDYIEETSESGTLIRVYTPVGKKEQGRFGLEAALKSLKFFENYFKIPYPLPKLDLIAIADFSSGAMENWGLVTYREVCLLIDPEMSSVVCKQIVAIVVAHEIAHQWFGNLVTMEWWTHLWLNEGFASFLENLCVDNIFPEYNIWTQFITNTLTNALELDALKNSHPIEVAVGHPSEVDEIFDDVSYKKGSSIIRMLNNVIGDKTFQQGLHEYLSRFMYSNASTEDLWDHFEKASGQPIQRIMQMWSKQTGFPLITVSSTASGNDRILKVSQERFASIYEPKDNSKWMVPLTFSTQADPNGVAKNIVLEDETMEIKFENIPSDHWIKVNPGTVGFYRVQYSPEMLNQFMPSIRDGTLPASDRLGLQNDLFALIQIGKIPTTEALSLMEAFSNETDYNVWTSISQCLATLKVLMSYTDSISLFNNFGCKLFSKIFNQIGWDPKPNDSHLDTLLRSLVIGRLVSFEDKLTLEEAKKRFLAHTDGTATIPSDLRTAVYRAVISQGDETVLDQMINLYNNSDLDEEKNRIGRSLGSVKDQNLVKKVLEFAVSENVRSQDTVHMITAASISKESHALCWKFFKKNKEDFRRRYKGGFLICRLVKGVTENFCTEEMAKAVKEFFEENSFPGTGRNVEQAIESIMVNARWLDRDAKLIEEWLQSRQ